jgi:methionyl aminopeptidase
MGTTIKSKKDIKMLRESGKILAEALQAVAELAKEGAKREVSTKDLDALAEQIIRKRGGVPAFLGYSDGPGRGFPAALCVSLNHEIVHGVPRHNRFLKAGDLVKLDLGVNYHNLFTDSAVTVVVGKVDNKIQKMVEVTKRSLEIGMEQIYPGSKLGNYGNAVEKYVTMNNFAVVRGLVGHGVGYAVHEAPQIPNYGKVNKGKKLTEGMVLALEPMVNEFSEGIMLAEDGFTFITEDRGLSAHFEHTVAVTENGFEILTLP